MHVEKRTLPGIGVCQRFTTASGQQAGLIAHPNGRRDLVIYHPNDPDTALYTLSLGRTEAQVLSGLLEAVVTVEHLVDLERQVPGLAVVRIAVALGAPGDGRAWRDVDLAGQALSLLAVIRNGETITAPGDDFVVIAGDEVVVAGSEAAVTAAARAIG
ncbi:TrkA domain protein [Micromonospora viridifaciens]|uniref:TrkA domain protein n=1 Tax=Micromonospora viridifaciens TaxID=1881 RepID=A0A1C4Y583_MICVI|nr:TrkA C-terminal domain-containing protein [Micromonospora viridifaciens]SCF15840.1 TrkA domain protein [Micromonospora viridifaciens]